MDTLSFITEPDNHYGFPIMSKISNKDIPKPHTYEELLVLYNRAGYNSMEMGEGCTCGARDEDDYYENRSICECVEYNFDAYGHYDMFDYTYLILYNETEIGENEIIEGINDALDEPDSLADYDPMERSLNIPFMHKISEIEGINIVISFNDRKFIPMRKGFGTSDDFSGSADLDNFIVNSFRKGDKFVSANIFSMYHENNKKNIESMLTPEEYNEMKSLSTGYAVSRRFK